MAPPVQTRRSRRACAFRKRTGAVPVPPAVPPPPPVQLSGRAAFEAALAATLQGREGERLAALWPSHGWRPPPSAQRDGGLWLLPTERIGALPPPMPAIPNDGSSPFEELYIPAAAMAPAAPWGCLGALPSVDCARRQGEPLPLRTLELVRAGMCCVLNGARLWPAAEDQWASADYLRHGLSGVQCNVLSAPADGRRFSYWFEHSDRVQAGYKAAPLVKAQTMTIAGYLRA